MLQQYVPLPKVIVTVDERVAPVFPSTKTACQIPSQGSSTCPNATACTKSTVIREKAALRLIASPCPLRSEEHTSELQSHSDLVCRLLLEKKKTKQHNAPLRERLHAPEPERELRLDGRDDAVHGRHRGAERGLNRGSGRDGPATCAAHGEG